MDQTPRLALSGVVLDSPDAGALAGFYRRLLGWEVEQDEPGWVKLRSRDGGAGLSFQTEPRYVRPVWPARPGDQQMQVHLDIAVEDLAAAGEHARPCAAIVTPRRPFEPGSTRDPAVASGESRVKRGDRVAGIDTELAEKPGRDDLCPCGPGRRFPPVLRRTGRFDGSPAGYDVRDRNR